MPEFRFVLWGPPRTKKNRMQPGRRPCETFQLWEDEARKQLARLRRMDLRHEGEPVSLPITIPCTLDVTFYIKGSEGDFGGYLDALCDVLDGTLAKQEQRRRKQRTQIDEPLVCDWQIVSDDKQFNKGTSGRVIRVKDEPRVEVCITW